MAYQNVFSVQRPSKKLPVSPYASYNKQPSTPTVSTRPLYSPVKPYSQASTPTASATKKPLASFQYQASGYTPQYAINQPKVDQPTIQKPIVEKPIAPAVPTIAQTRMSDIMKSADQRKVDAQTQGNQQADYIRRQYQLANENLKGQVPEARRQFDASKANTEATIADLLASGERQKSQASDHYGAAQRQAASTLRETQGQTAKTFANLGTIDSRGEGSFAQANENVMSDFNRTTQEFLKAKADKLTEIDSAVATAERSARQRILEEEKNLSELERSIQYAIANNDLQQARELTQAHNQVQNYIQELSDSVSEMKYSFALEQQSLEAEAAKMQSFSPEFMATGKPTNQAEYEFWIKNQDAYQKIGASGGTTKPKTSAQLQVEGKAGAGMRALDTIETQILNNPFVLQQMMVPGSPGARQMEAAMSSLTDAIGGLRTGASVSPDQQKFYRNILPKAGDSRDTIQYKLNTVRQELEGYLQGSQGTGNEIPPELLSILGL